MKEKKKLQRANPKKFSNDEKARNNEVVVEKVTKRGWSDVFDKLDYSNGPGDNIYVFG